MENIFSATEVMPELDPSFGNQRQSGQQPSVPSCTPSLPAPSITLPTPNFDDLAARSAPGHAAKDDPYVWPPSGR